MVSIHYFECVMLTAQADTPMRGLESGQTSVQFLAG